MRWGLEQSRNLMTVRAAAQTGMDKVVKTAKTMGLGEYPSVLAISLGAGETTVLKLVNPYSMMVNGGKQLAPPLIDLVQNGHGDRKRAVRGRSVSVRVDLGGRRLVNNKRVM